MADEEVTSTGADFQEAVATMDKYDYTAPDPADYGVWIPGIPVLVENVPVSYTHLDVYKRQ